MPWTSRSVTVADSADAPFGSASATEANGRRLCESLPASVPAPAVRERGATSRTSVPVPASWARRTRVPSARLTPTCATTLPPEEMLSSPPCTRALSPGA